ncbi:MAG: DEAD/DEAH box helicase [Bacteroidales bacterium]|nr:DEAD/DEAH box helicase [Bacteroidales bacterium]
MKFPIDEILSRLGLESLTDMQQQMYQVGRQRGGVVLLSPTGSGKTLAFLLPLLERLDENADSLQAVVVVPTRELALQHEDVLKRMKTPLRHLCLYGGRPTMEEHRSLRRVNPHLVVATPGRLCDHLAKQNLQPDGVRVLVFDEFDKCLELGFRTQMEHIVGDVRAGSVWLLSATRAEVIPSFMLRATAGSPITLDFLQETAPQTDGRIRTFRVSSPQPDKLETAGRLLACLKGEPAIVFVAHRESVERVGQYLREKGFEAALYHGGMEQMWRERALYRFRCGAANVLVSTDLAARGLDIPEVRAVVHYHLPLRKEDYTHRNGRTARWQADGNAYLLTGPTETLPEFAGNAEDYVWPEGAETQMPTPARYGVLYIGRGKQDKLSKADVLGFLCKKGGLKAAQIGRIDVGPHYAYAAVLRSQLKQLLRRIAGEKIKGMKTLVEEMRK